MNFVIDLKKAKECQLNSPLRDESAMLHENIKVEFVLPDGTEKIVVCSIGETVDMIRERLAASQHCPFACSFYHEEQYMMDPLSLNDFPAIVKKVNEKELVKIEIRSQ